jgi:hypothetical protein
MNVCLGVPVEPLERSSRGVTTCVTCRAGGARYDTGHARCDAVDAAPVAVAPPSCGKRRRQMRATLGQMPSTLRQMPSARGQMQPTPWTTPIDRVRDAGHGATRCADTPVGCARGAVTDTDGPDSDARGPASCRLTGIIYPRRAVPDHVHVVTDDARVFFDVVGDASDGEGSARCRPMP